MKGQLIQEEIYIPGMLVKWMVGVSPQDGPDYAIFCNARKEARSYYLQAQEQAAIAYIYRNTGDGHYRRYQR